MKLGEILLEKGLIGAAQLKEALDAQLIFGGHLGTCLMERKHISEEVLGRVLAEHHKVAYAAPALFENIPPSVISTLTDRLVERHRCVPFRLKDHALDVAMVEPTNLLARDEISFASGCKVRPWVAPEARIYQAMERYYDIPRRLRYVTLCGDVVADVTLESASPRPSKSETRAPAVAAERPAAPAEPRDAPASDPLAAFSRRLASTESVDEIVEIALEQVAHTLDRSVFFMVRAGQALPWQASGIPADPSGWSGLSFGIPSEPLFSLLEGEDLYRGPVPHEAPYFHFYDVLGIDVPNEALIVPAHADDRLVAVLYGDAGPGGNIRGEDEHFRRLARKTAVALQLVHLRRKIASL